MKHLILAASLFFVLTKAFSADDHDHKKEVKANSASQPHSDEKHNEEEDHDHAKDEDHDEHGHEKEEGHAEHDEENSQVGPNKGITEATEEDGIKLSPEAEKNFEIEKLEVSNASSISIEKTSLVTSGLEVNVYRYRNGFYKRVDFSVISRNEGKLVITSKDISKGDSIVTKGLGFILIAEIAAFGGAPEGHSH